MVFYLTIGASINLYRTLIMKDVDRIMDLTPVQRDILTALINIHRVEGRAVKGEEIAELIDRNPGTIRNQMQSLKALNLVEGVPGPKGGYKATGSAYEALSIDATGDVVTVPVLRNGVLVEGATASEIVFNKVMHSQQCDGVIRVIGNIRDFDIGDEIEVGPTPVNKLYIRGKIVGRDDTMSRLILQIKEMISVPKVAVKKIARRAVRIPPGISLQEASRILVHNGVHEALVEDSSPGLINLEDVARAVADGKINQEVKEIMTRGFLTIDSNEPIYEAIKMLGRTGADQLVVSENDALWGIVTPNDIVKSLTPA
jgi:predicted transcriptional regulator